MRRLAPLLAVFALFGAAHAVNPDERLEDAAEEARARGITKDLRCLVCENQSVDDSNADLARDLRLLVRERIVAGDSDEEVVDYVVERYGEYVLLRPRFSWRNAALWAAPILVVAFGAGLAVYFVRGQKATPPTPPLTEEEARALEAALKKDAPPPEKQA